MMIGFAPEIERVKGQSPRDAILQGRRGRVRPIMAILMVAILGAPPLMFVTRTGPALHRPLKLAIVGGLIVRQVLTLFIGSIIHLYLDRLAVHVWDRGPSSGLTGAEAIE